MDFNATVDLIIRDLKEAGEIIDDLKNYPGVPLIQVELAKSKCRSAGEVIALLKTLKEEKSNEARSVTAADERIVRTETATKSEKSKKVPVIEELIITHDANTSRNPEVTVEADEAKITESTSKKPEPVSKKMKEGSKIIADTFGHLPDRLNEQLGSKREENGVTEMMRSQHVSNLGDAIGVNDKFLYIREIFNGNSDSYFQALTRIESAADYNEAKAVIMSYAGNNPETEVVKQLLGLVKRKFSANE